MFTRLQKSFAGSSAKILRLTTLILFGVFLIVPGSESTPFSGLPLSSREALAVLIIIVAITTTGWETRSKKRHLAPAVILLLIGWQLIGATFMPYGWAVCVRRAIMLEALHSRCEPSAQFRQGEYTYTYRQIMFQDKTFPLYYLNDTSSFNFYKQDEPDRYHMPYTLRAESNLLSDRGDTLSIVTTIPGVLVNIDSSRYRPEPGAKLIIPLQDNQSNRVSVEYSTKRNDNNFLEVSTTATPFYRINLWLSKKLLDAYQVDRKSVV